MIRFSKHTHKRSNSMHGGYQMGGKKWAVSVSVLGIALSTLSASAQDSEPTREIANIKEVATVNQHGLTRKDLEDSLTGLNQGQKNALLGNPETKGEAVKAMVGQELLMQEAQREGLDQTRAFQEGMNLAKKQLLINQLIEKKFSSKLTPAAVKKFYSAKSDFFNRDEVRVQHILLRSEKEAEKVMSMAMNSENDFQDLADKHSVDPSAKNNRGDLGYIMHDRLVPEFTEAAFAAKNGDIVGPVHTIYGYHVIKVIARKAGAPIEFAEVEPRAKQLLLDQLTRNYVAELRHKASIQIHDMQTASN